MLDSTTPQFGKPLTAPVGARREYEARKADQQEFEAKKGEPQEQPLPANDGAAFGYSWHLIWHGEVDPTSARKWLVQDLLPETGVALISGQWGTYKTFVANDLSAAVMTGTTFINRQVMRKRKSGPNGEEFSFQTNEAEIGPEKTLTIRWTDAAAAAKPKKKDDPWAAKSLRHLRQTMTNMLADCGSEQRPYPDGPIVRTVAIEIVRAEFCKSYPATGNETANK